ncbi:integral membrane protein [Streptomyces viridochromogenes DSM 40736]|uniref:Integral membrane protein n=1 Tax=Streptomyces viridochromogenes (strain DSM 40736 / JCM 4977 / BCRC 1201 / Tue 494) TaxID=591159 RepID=D9X3G7_STRVT|nr:integral membrane protein [Streptomyces viridochromogenes DSM 40736]
MTTLARWARAEWGPLYATVRGPLRERRWRAVPMAVTAVCLTAVLHFVHSQSWGYRFVQDVGAVRAEDPLWLALLRTPLSLFVPALDLPVWGALAQILVVFGVAELCLGRGRTLLIAYVATLAGTLYARLGVWLGADFPLGLPASNARVVGHRAVGGVGGSCRVPGPAPPRVRHGRGGDRGDGGRGRGEGEPRGQGAPGGDRGRAGAVRGRELRQRRSRDRVGSGSGAPPIQS